MPTPDDLLPASRPLLRSLGNNWWLMLLRGLCAVIFGILAFAWPNITLFVLVILFGVYVLVDGLLTLVSVIRGRPSKKTSAPLWWLLIAGVAGIVAGLLTFAYPQVTELVLVFFIGAWALVCGVFEIIGAIKLRREINHEWLLIIAGLLSVLFGVVILLYPGAGALALLWLIGGYAILLGLLMIWLSLRLRTMAAKQGASHS